MTNNNMRADWAEAALQEFSGICGPPLADDGDAEDCIADLISNLLHYAEQRGIDDPVRLAARGVGMWSAERRAPDHEPPVNDYVDINITHAFEPEP